MSLGYSPRGPRRRPHRNPKYGPIDHRSVNPKYGREFSGTQKGKDLLRTRPPVAQQFDQISRAVGIAPGAE